MLYTIIMAVCSQIHTKHINTLCGQNVELLNVKPGGTYSDHWAVEGCTSLLFWPSWNAELHNRKSFAASILKCSSPSA
jgi:hypothetical protein